jgi:two-component system nitrogen regulation response regulator GlnG
MDGLTALGRLRKMTHEAPVVVMTAFGNLDTAVRAVEGGAFDYLIKPFDLGQVLETVTRALHVLPASPEPPPASDVIETGGMVGHSAAMQAVFKRIALVAPRDAHVVITGESGTGKELVARAIHRHSGRRDRPFLPVHIASLNPNLVESELFGHVRGAFTGAAQARPGLLSLADGGTVFLDELAEIPLQVQVKLLRVLEQGTVLPVGGTEPQPLNVRILSATHQNLAQRMEEGAFRKDLFFRLNVFQVHLPPLRERTDDLVDLADHFLRRFEPRALPLRPETLKFLAGLPWPGNVRELRNALEHAAIVARGSPLLPSHFPVLSSGPEEPGTADQLALAVRRWLAHQLKDSPGGVPTELYAALLACIEPALLADVMQRVDDNRWVAAQWLGLNRATVRKKLRAYGLADPAKPDDDE